jgi:hypothetical protein
MEVGNERRALEFFPMATGIFRGHVKPEIALTFKIIQSPITQPSWVKDNACG